MKVVLAHPQVESIQTGNLSTAHQWAAIFKSLGHQPIYSVSPEEEDAEILVALHASKCHHAIVSFRKQYPSRPLVLGLAGTDIYPEPDEDSQASMRVADVIVVLQKKALARIPPDQRSKARVIIQSAEKRMPPHDDKSTDPFRICVAGHLRDVKDPMRAAIAARTLPPDSKIQIAHAGAILEPKYRDLVAAELEKNPRYRYLGGLSEFDLRTLMWECQATVLTSLSEGGARVIGESMVEGTPVIASRIDGVTGLLGDTYPGLFTAGDTTALRDLLWRLENDLAFRTLLQTETDRLAPQFALTAERATWKALLAEFAQP